MSRFLLEVITPDALLFREEVESVIAPASEGELGVLGGHMPLVACLRPGKLHYRSGDSAGTFVIGAGVIDVRRGLTRVIAESGQAWIGKAASPEEK